MTAEELARIEGLLEKATPGPWEVRQDTDTSYLYSDGEDVVVGELDTALDNQAVALLVNSAPALIALARRALELESALEWLRVTRAHLDVEYVFLGPDEVVPFAKQRGWTPTAKGEANE